MSKSLRLGDEFVTTRANKQKVSCRFFWTKKLFQLKSISNHVGYCLIQKYFISPSIGSTKGFNLAAELYTFNLSLISSSLSLRFPSTRSCFA